MLDCDDAAVMHRAGEELLDRPPWYVLGALCFLTLVLLAMLGKTVHWRRDREAYLTQARLWAKSRGEKSEAYARGFVAFGWLTFVGFLLMFGLVLWPALFQRRFDGGIWVVLASQVFIWAGLILPYFLLATLGHAGAQSR